MAGSGPIGAVADGACSPAALPRPRAALEHPHARIRHVQPNAPLPAGPHSPPPWGSRPLAACAHLIRACTSPASTMRSTASSASWGLPSPACCARSARLQGTGGRARQGRRHPQARRRRGQQVQLGTCVADEAGRERPGGMQAQEQPRTRLPGTSRGRRAAGHAAVPTVRLSSAGTGARAGRCTQAHTSA